MGQSGRVVVHDFVERLEWSQALSDEAAWVAFYRRVWPEAIAIVRADADSRWQRWGVDRWIVLPNGRQLLIDEKKRDTDYADVLLEEWSVFKGEGHPQNKIGWTLDGDKRTDFIAYAIPRRGICYLLPFELLRLAYITHRSDWQRDGWYPKDARNNGYVTRNCAVPWITLRAGIVEQMHRRFGDRLPLPAARREKVQLTFEWEAGDVPAL